MRIYFSILFFILCILEGLGLFWTFKSIDFKVTIYNIRKFAIICLFIASFCNL